MTDDVAYRLFLLFVALVQNGFCFGYLKRAGAGATIFQRREEGPLLTAAIAITFAAYCIEVLAYVVDPRSMAWSAIELTEWIRWLGAVPVVAGTAMIMWGVHHLGNNITISVSTRSDHELITSGPYRWVRHPLYSALLLGSIGVSMLIANWCVAATSGTFWLLIAYRTRIEENNLTKKFGEAYREYKRRTGKFFPRVHR